jgi:hypothetical protein
MPVDHINARADIQTPELAKSYAPEPFEYNSLLYVPKYNPRDGNVTGYYSHSDNLRLTMFPYRNELHISGSLHSWYHGNNHCPFSVSDLKASIEQLNEVIGGKLLDAHIKQIEFGVNCNNTERLIDNAIEYKGKPFNQMHKQGKSYGKKATQSQCEIKVYHKDQQNELMTREKLESPIQRYETYIHRMIHLQKRSQAINLYTIKDLLSMEILQMMADDLIQKIKTIQFANAIPPGMTLSEAEVWSAFTNPWYIDFIKTYHKHTYTRQRAIFNRLKKKANAQDYKSEFDEVETSLAIMLDS